MLEPIIRKNAFEGKGEVTLRPLLTDEQKNEKIQMYAEVTIPEGASLGIHRHRGNAESYYILSGTGLYTDDGKTYEVHAGDTTYCADSHCHGLENTGDSDLRFMALIIPS